MYIIKVEVVHFPTQRFVGDFVSTSLVDTFKKLTQLEQEKVKSHDERMDTVKKITQLEQEKVKSNDERMQLIDNLKKHKMEIEIQEEAITELEQTTKNNIELKELLAVKEKELKRLNEEKKVVLDELLKQTVKKNPLKGVICVDSPDVICVDSPEVPSDKSDLVKYFCFRFTYDALTFPSCYTPIH